MSSGLEEYRQKRDLERSPEPPALVKPGAGPLTFVVQKHRARRLHYDFRLEVDGVLKSWAVPKGPSLDPDQKRLAAMVEDHPFDYASFEGVIPAGEYGAGEVIVWDAGTYSPDEASPREGGKFLFDDREAAQAEMRRGLEKGKLSFFLRGGKLRGSWTLVKTRRGEKDWLLIKHRDEFARADYDVLNEERSVVSGRTIEEVKAGRRPVGHSPGGESPGGVQPESALTKALDPSRVPGSAPARFPGFVAPMLAGLADAPFSHPDWVYEPKLDGYRTIATVSHGKVGLWSRRGMKVTEKYASITPGLGSQPVSEAVLDGEIVAMDERGQVCFQCLQQYLQTLGAGKGKGQVPLIYYVFDVIYLDGYDLRSVPLRLRKELLRAVLRTSDDVRPVDFFETDGKTLYEAAIRNGLEGIIAKRADSTYESGRRSRDWLKIKAMHTDDFVIAGYTAGESARAGSFGALLLGYYGEKGKLSFAGHVGSGFDEQKLGELRSRLDAIRTDRCPFSEVPETNTTPTWVRPELVAEVKYSQWTGDGRLRTPVFLRLREDKAPAEARRAEVVAVPALVTEDRLPSPPRQNEAADKAPNGAADLVTQLSNPRESFRIEVEGSRIGLTNVDKVLWPATEAHAAITKRHFLTYLAQVSGYLLPHLKDRPITLSRYPDGINGEHFWQKHWSHPIPEFVETLDITEEKGKSGRYMMCNNLPTLMWLGQLADIEFHTWFSRVSAQPDMDEAVDGEAAKEADPASLPLPLRERTKVRGNAAVDRLLDYPDFIIFDLDPYLYSGKEAAGAEPELNRAAFARGCEVALWLKDVLDSLSLSGFVKTSGKTGLHIFVPVVRNLDYRQVRRAAETVGKFLMQKHSGDITMEWVPEKRTGKVFMDYAQNVRGKTLASAYSPRPYAEATVSAPVRWDELGKVYPTDFTILTMSDRLNRIGDLWADILKAKRDLGEVLGTRTMENGDQRIENGE